MHRDLTIVIPLVALTLGALSHLALSSCRSRGGADTVSSPTSELMSVTFEKDTCLKFDTDVPNWSCSEESRTAQSCTVEAGDKIEAIGMFRASADAKYWLFGRVSAYTPAPPEDAETPATPAAADNTTRPRCTQDLINERVANPKRLAWLWSPDLNMSESSTPGVQQAIATQTLEQANITTGVFTNGWGPRWGRMHRGIDVAAPVGTPIRAACGGTVSFSGWNDGGFGNLIEIDHEPGTCGSGVLMTRYAHNSRLLKRGGQPVAAGELIAEMGSTGRSTGPHLHFESHTSRGAQNPMSVLIGQVIRVPGRILEWFWNLFSLSSQPFLQIIGSTSDADRIGREFNTLLQALVQTDRQRIVLRDQPENQLAVAPLTPSGSSAITAGQIGFEIGKSEFSGAGETDGDVFFIDLHGGAELPE